MDFALPEIGEGVYEAELTAWLRKILAHVLLHEMRRFGGAQRRDVDREVSLEQALTEDSEMTVRLYLAGYNVQLVPTSVSWEQEPESLRVWFKQRRRWVRGFNYVLKKHSTRLLRAKPPLRQISPLTDARVGDWLFRGASFRRSPHHEQRSTLNLARLYGSSSSSRRRDSIRCQLWTWSLPMRQSSRNGDTS